MNTIDQLLEQLAKARDENDQEKERLLTGMLGNEYFSLGDFHRAVEFYESAQDLAGKVGDLYGEALALNNLGKAYLALEEVDNATEFYKRALDIVHHIEDSELEINILSNLGLAYDKLNKDQRAIESYEQALHLARSIGDRKAESTMLNNLGNAYAALGEDHRAIELYEQAIELARLIDDRKVESAILNNLGNAYAALGEDHRAIELYEQAIELARPFVEQNPEYVEMYRNRGDAYADLLEKSEGAHMDSEDSFEQRGVLPSVAADAGILRPASLPRRFSFLRNRPAPFVVLLLFLLIVLLIFFSGYLISAFSPSKPQGCNLAQNTALMAACVVQAAGGEYIGVSDGTFMFDSHRPDGPLKQAAADKLRTGDSSGAQELLQSALTHDPDDAEALINLENQRIRASKLPYITFVVITTLSGSNSTINVGRSVLQGVYIAQKEYNAEVMHSNRLSVYLLIGNVGDQSTFAPLVAGQIVQLSRSDRSIAGTLGWPFSTDSTINAIRRLNDAHIPTIAVSPTVSSASVKVELPYYFKIVPPLTEQAIVGAKFAEKVLHAKTAALFYDPADPYSAELANAFRNQFSADGNSTSVDEPYTRGHPETILDLLRAALRANPDIIYFAGYADDISILLNNLPTPGPQVLGSDALDQLVRYPKSTSAGFNRLYFTTFAYPDIWQSLNLSRTEPPSFFADYAKTFDPHAQHIGNPYGYSQADDTAILSYDAATLSLTAFNSLASDKTDFTHEALQRALIHITGSRSFQGISGQIAFDTSGDPVQKVVVVLNIDTKGSLRLVWMLGRYLKNTRP